jgi:hypothetical protein
MLNEYFSEVDSNGSADSGIEECAMEVSISEPSTTEVISLIVRTAKSFCTIF